MMVQFSSFESQDHWLLVNHRNLIVLFQVDPLVHHSVTQIVHYFFCTFGFHEIKTDPGNTGEDIDTSVLCVKLTKNMILSCNFRILLISHF